MSLRKTLAGALSAAAALILSGALAGNALAQALDGDKPATVAAPAPTPRPVDLKAPFAKLNGKAVTAEEIGVILAARPPMDMFRMTVEQFVQLPEDQQKRMLQSVAREEVAGRRAETQKMVLPPESEARLANAIQGLRIQALWQENVQPKLKPVTAEDVAKFYEADANKQFEVKERWEIRTIYVGTYKTHVVTEGETLKSIAKAISGDEAAFDKILTRETSPPSPRIELGTKQVTTEVEGAAKPAAPVAEFPPRALQPGEVLLVPISEADAQALANRIEGLKAKVADGAKFEEVAKAESEAENPGRVLRYTVGVDKPFAPQIMEAMTGLKSGEMAGPIRTRHGFHLVQLVSHTPAGKIPFDQVKLSIEQDLNRQGNEQVALSFVNALIDARQSKGMKLNRELIAKPLRKEEADTKPDGKPTDEFLQRSAAYDKDIVFTLGDLSMTREDFVGGWNRIPPAFVPKAEGATEADAASNRDNRKPLEKVTDEELRKALPYHVYLQRALLSDEAIRLGLDKRPDLVRKAEEARIGELARHYFMSNRTLATREPSDEEVKAYFDKNQDKFVAPETVVLSSITLTNEELDRNAATKAAKIEEFKTVALRELKGVQNQKEFSEAGDRIGRILRGVRAGQLGSVPVGSLDAAVASELSKNVIKTHTQPVQGRDGIEIYWIEERREKRVIPFEEAKANAKEVLVNERLNEAMTKLAAELDTAATVELLQSPTGKISPADTAPKEAAPEAAQPAK